MLTKQALGGLFGGRIQLPRFYVAINVPCQLLDALRKRHLVVDFLLVENLVDAAVGVFRVAKVDSLYPGIITHVCFIVSDEKRRLFFKSWNTFIKCSFSTH
ncbi:MAG: hypothetical protein E6868_22525 [Pantoea sp.]|uniref:hypothetical protein n=1 Tax=Pantoea sp. TaxID=69393 RepID=UPI00290198AC|nr:hypothetical protein [Pantoea sp.]MDU1575996.1 hypothetical protein [Pantoea sp.]